jgi:hypothetical protein
MRTFSKAAIVAAALMIPAAAFAGQAAKKAPAKTEAKAEKKAPAVHTASTSGTVKSSSDSSLVITKGGKDETFTVNASTKKEGTIETGAKVTVAYTKDGANMVATSIKAAPAKAAKPAAKAKKK